MRREKIIVRIRNNETGEIRDYHTEGFGEEGKPNAWYYSDGNGSCDCNRTLYFQRANKEEEYFDTECGDVKFSIQIINQDGKVYYDELEGE